MRLSLDATGSANTIQAYGQGFVRINTQDFQRSVIVTPEQIIADWPPQKLTDLQPAHLIFLRNLTPQIVLLGTGQQQHFPDLSLLRPLIEQGLGVEIMGTAAACRTYNIIVAEGRQVAAALLLE